MSFINVGFGNLINASKVVAIVSADSAPAKRQLQKTREEGLLVDATSGRRTKSLIVTDCDKYIASALTPETLLLRLDSSVSGGLEDE
ncbi:MAG: DUF370 domain-containing protein [Eubacterium sp.]|nr:DUF370 domain-containing protein [Eubacterium sp.]